MFGQDDNQQQQQGDNGQQWQPQPDPAQSPAAAPSVPVEPTTPAIPATDDNQWQQPAPQAPINDAPQQSAPTTPNASADLLDIKQQALQELSPLVSHLEQNPEEKFKTTMMMIQASDDQSLVPEAYAAAQAITDGKAKAQALLDIVNEINYFTQHEQN